SSRADPAGCGSRALFEQLDHAADAESDARQHDQLARVQLVVQLAVRLSVVHERAVDLEQVLQDAIVDVHAAGRSSSASCTSSSCSAPTPLGSASSSPSMTCANISTCITWSGFLRSSVCKEGRNCGRRE